MNPVLLPKVVKPVILAAVRFNSSAGCVGLSLVMLA